MEINFQNGLAVVLNSETITNHPQKIQSISPSINEWKSIEFTSGVNDCHIFENNQIIAFNILHFNDGTECLRPAYISKQHQQGMNKESYKLLKKNKNGGDQKDCGIVQL